MKLQTTHSTLFSLALLLALAPALCAQTTLVSAPLPAQLATAKTVFISNASDMIGNYSQAMFDQAYAAVQGLNRFTFVSSPQQADLVLQFSVSAEGSARTLHIVDPKTSVILWSVSESLQPAARAKTIDKNLQVAFDQLARDIQTVCAPPPATH
jgi:hypothetical protein